MKAFTLTGRQLATGTTLTEPQAFGPPQTQKIDGDPFAAIAGVCAVAGIALSLVGRKMAGASAISGGVGAMSLLILRVRLDGQIQSQGQGLATTEYATGYVFSIVLLIIGTVWNAYLFIQSRRVEGEGPSRGEFAVAQSDPTTRGTPQ